MSSYNLQEPQSGDPLRADWAADLVREIRANTLTSVVGGTFQRDPGGTSITIGTREGSDESSGLRNAEDPIPCKITSGNSLEGYAVTFYGNGIGAASTGSGTLWILEIAGMASLPAGSYVLGWPGLTISTGGNEPNV